MSSNNLNNHSNSHDNSNSQDDKYYDDNYSMNVSYNAEIETCKNFLILVPTNTRLREIEHINLDSNTGNLNTRIFNNENISNNNTSNNINTNNNNNNVRGESSMITLSNFNLNVYSMGQNLEDSNYANRNFDSHLDEIFDNLTYLITNEK